MIKCTATLAIVRSFVNTKWLTGWLLIILSGVAVQAQNPLVSAFEDLSQSPQPLPFRNALTINNEGGHIQGIQAMHFHQQAYAILTGSSSTVSYYTVVRLDQHPEVISVDTLLAKPFKHAGGFQINDGLMAIGIEDNEAKNISQVLVYEVSDPEKIPLQPVQVIERRGETERTTAGCIAIAHYQDQYVMLVGDWDTRHLDVYRISDDEINRPDASFTLTQSIALADQTRSQWIDETWWSYQNINLFVSEDTLFLIGLGVNDQQENIANLFTVRLSEEQILTKVASQHFPATERTSFVWGAGVDWQPEANRLQILSTTHTISDSSEIIVYR